MDLAGRVNQSRTMVDMDTTKLNLGTATNEYSSLGYLRKESY